MKENSDLQLSIIIPVYQVEKYVRPCLESVFKQGLDDEVFEVIIVNDGTKDRSMEVIQDIIDSHKNITVINQENQGLSMARNNGMAIARGEYILFVDSDDLLIENSLGILLQKAHESSVDMLIANYLEMNDEEISNYQGTVQKNFQMKEKNGEVLFLEDFKPYRPYVWCALYKQEFLIKNKITFVPGIFYEDIPFSHECYLKAGHCILTPWLLNIYRRRSNSITASYAYRYAIDYSTAVAKTWDLRGTANIPPRILYQLEENAYFLFMQTIYHTIYGVKNRSEKRRIIQAIKMETLHIDFNHSFRQRLTSFMVKEHPFIFIDIYSLWICLRKFKSYFKI